MTAQERIDAALAARDKATPGPLKVVFKGAIDKYVVEKQEGGVHRQLAYCGHADALLFAAAPDLVDEVIRLRKWQREAMPWLSYASDRYWEKNHHHDGVGRNNDLDRLITEAQGD